MTFSQALAMLPYMFQQRYSPDKYIGWANEWLRRLSRERVLPELVKEIGVEVDNLRWITKPTGYVSPREVYHPAQREVVFSVEDSGNLLTFADKSKTFQKDETHDITATTFSGYSLTGIVANIGTLSEDDLKDSLLVIDGGTEAGTKIRIAGNTASSGGNTTLTFMFPLSTALSATKITSCYVVDKFHHLILRYQSAYDTVATIGEIIPVNDVHQGSLLAYWNWKANAMVVAFGNEAKEWESQFEKELSKTKMAVLGGNRSRRAVPRYMAGLRQEPHNRYTRTHTTVSQ